MHQDTRRPVSSTVTKRNPRPRKYGSASERQAAYRARAPEVCFRAESRTVDTLDGIARDLDISRADLLLSMTKFALTNHDWARFGLTHRPLPFEYGIDKPKDNPIMATRTPTPAQLAARERFAQMARSGAFKKKRKAAAKKTNPRKKTVSEKISQLSREGYPQKQAVAIALSEQRAGKVKATPRKTRTLGKAERRGKNPAPMIRVGDFVRSYDFPGMHDDHYLEGTVIEVRPSSYVIEVQRRVVGGQEKVIPPSLRRVEAPKGPHFMTGVHGVQVIGKGSRRKANPVAFTDAAAHTRSDAKVVYAVHTPGHDDAVMYFKKKAEAIAAAQKLSDRMGKVVAVTRKQIYFGA